jgi:hypothetical protein
LLRRREVFPPPLRLRCAADDNDVQIFVALQQKLH